MSAEFHFAPKWSPKGWQLVMSLCTVVLLLLWLLVLRRNITIPSPLQMNSIPKNVIFYHWHQRVKHPFLCRGLLFLLFLVPGIPFVWTWIIGGSLFRFALLFFRQMSRGFKTAAFPCSSIEVTVTPWRAWVPPPLAGSQFHPFLKVISLLKRESSWRPFSKIFFPSLDPIKLWSWWQVRTACTENPKWSCGLTHSPKLSSGDKDPQRRSSSFVMEKLIINGTAGSCHEHNLRSA